MLGCFVPSSRETKCTGVMQIYLNNGVPWCRNQHTVGSQGWGLGGWVWRQYESINEKKKRRAVFHDKADIILNGGMPVGGKRRVRLSSRRDRLTTFGCCKAVC